jgi:hypothetical protein
MRAALICVLGLSFIGSIQAGESTFRFQEQVIDADIGKVCYAVTLADVNGDGRQDVVAVSENKVFWYENDTWRRHVIIADQTVPDNVCIAPHDIDGDGQVDFALGAGWMGKNTGTIQWLRRAASLGDPWQVIAIGAEPSLHRMRWADVLGTGRPQLVISPLNASQGKGVRLMAFEIPTDPARDRWPSTVLNAELNRVHNHWHPDLNQNGRAETLAASREGITLIEKQGEEFVSRKFGQGATAEKPDLNGAGEVKTGKLSGGRDFIATVEPMHGTMLAVYLPPAQGDSLWTRHVVDSGFKRGHALWTADLDGDGDDEIVFGHSDTPMVPGVNVYDCLETDPTQWKKTIVDAGGMATEDLIVADLNHDRRPDIIAGGRATHNVKIYWSKP